MKKIIPIIIVGTSLLGGVSVAYAAKTDSSVWADSSAKEWGNTPESVKYVLSNVQISRSQGNNGNSKQTDLFSTKWLKEMQRSPSTYRLTESDKKWVDNVLANAEARNSNTWKPSNKTPIAPKVKENKTVTPVAEPKPIEVAKKEQKVEKNDKKSSIIPTGTGLTQEQMQKEVNRMTKAESKPLPTPKMEAKEKPDLTPVKTAKKEEVKDTNIPEKVTAKNEPLEKPEPTEMDKFIATLPVITDEDLPISEIEQTKEEMAAFREMYSEDRVNKAIEQSELNESLANTVTKDVDNTLKETNTVKPFESINKQEKESTEISKDKVDSSIEKATVEKTPIKNELVSQSTNNKEWIMSALTSLMIIAMFMFGIVLYAGNRLKKDGKLEKYI